MYKSLDDNSENIYLDCYNSTRTHENPHLFFAKQAREHAGHCQPHFRYWSSET